MRGSTPCHGDEIRRYGGNTSSVSVRAPGHDPVLFDLGTGVRYFGLGPSGGPSVPGLVPGEPPALGPCAGPAVLHSAAAYRGPNSTCIAPSQADGRTVSDVMTETIRPPLFPINAGRTAGRAIQVPPTSPTRSSRSASVEGDVPRLIPHIGRTCGYRVTVAGPQRQLSSAITSSRATVRSRSRPVRWNCARASTC